MDSPAARQRTQLKRQNVNIKIHRNKNDTSGQLSKAVPLTHIHDFGRTFFNVYCRLPVFCKHVTKTQPAIGQRICSSVFWANHREEEVGQD